MHLCNQSVQLHQAPNACGLHARPHSRSTICRFQRLHSSCTASCSDRSDVPQSVETGRWTHRLLQSATAFALSACLCVSGASARLEGVNKPELLPRNYTTVIDIAGFLTDGEEARIKKEVDHLEEDTGIKLRVLAQNYPQTPGLAVKDFWKVDDDTVVFVADPSLGNIINVNVGANVDLKIPRAFWSRLAGKYGNKFYWQEQGQEAAIVNAVSAIDSCAREPIGRLQCSTVQGELGEEASAGPISDVTKKLMGKK